MNTSVVIFLIFTVCSTLDAQTPCASSPCRAPSECENLDQEYVCHCRAGIKGQKCDRPMQTGDSPCLSSPCWNRGTCEAVGDSDFKCTCRSGFSGKDCRTIQSTACTTNNPCRNGATCLLISQNGTSSPVCFCTADWTGKNCENKLGLCDKPNPCYNGGTCVQNSCKCPQNYTGQLCETYDSDRILRVLNKGFFVTKLRLIYEVQNGQVKEQVTQTGKILIGQEKVFRIPESVDYNSEYGVTLILDVVLSFKKISVRVNANPECVHLWGICFAPKWSKVNCI